MMLIVTSLLRLCMYHHCSYSVYSAHSFLSLHFVHSQHYSRLQCSLAHSAHTHSVESHRRVFSFSRITPTNLIMYAAESHQHAYHSVHCRVAPTYDHCVHCRITLTFLTVHG